MKYDAFRTRCVRLALVPLGFLSFAATAAEFCATNRNELQTFLDTAATNGEADTIRVAIGNYPTPGSNFLYSADQAGGDDHDLTISGGWTELSGDPCGRLDEYERVGATALYGAHENRIMQLYIRESTNVTVRRIGFFYGNADGVNADGVGGALSIVVLHEDDGGYSGRIVVDRNLFFHNQAERVGALYIGGAGVIPYTAVRTPFRTSRMGVVNNVFVDNHARIRYGAALLLQDGSDDGAFGVGIYVTNNTILNNTEDQNGMAHGSFAVGGSTPNIYIINNNMWGNIVADLSVGGRPEPGVFETYRLQNNNIGTRTGRPPTSESGNISIEPEYVSCPSPCSGSEWVPAVNSPLIDAGIHPPNIAPFWAMPALDAAGNPRVAQGTVDIGAYENHDRFFADRFE